MTELKTERESAIERIRLKHARRGSMMDVAYYTIREAMRDGVLAPGEALTEVELAKLLDMSRTPVREALRRLETERLVENAPRRGLIVPTMTLDHLIEVFEIRSVLEGLAARRCAQRKGPNELAALAACIDQMERALADTDDDLLNQASSNFHRLLRSGSGMTRLRDMVVLMMDSSRSIGLHEFAQGRAAQAVAEHKAIFDAIAAGDPEAAEAAARSHSLNALQAQIAAHKFED
ncbi:MAG: GntR family transcriptional regulator [Thermomicrobiales bacterium]